MKKYLNALKQVLPSLRLDYILLFCSAFLINYCTLGYRFLTSSNMLELVNLPIYTILFTLAIVFIGVAISYYFSKKFFLKLVVGYFIYAASSYFIFITRNVNNSDLLPLKFLKNGFLELKFIVPSLIILAIGIISRYLFRELGLRSKFNQLGYSYTKELYLLSILTSSFAINDDKLFRNISSNLDIFLNEDLSGYFPRILALTTGVMLIGFLLVSFFIFKALSDFKSNQPSIEMAITSSLFWAVVFNYTLQLGIRTDEALFGQFIFPGGTLYQIIILFLVYLTVYILINKYVYASVLISFSGIAVSVANYIKSNMRNEPLLVTDFSWLKQFKLILSFVDSKIAILTVLAVLASIVAIVFLRKRWVAGQIIKQNKIRLIMAASILSAFVAVYSIFVNEENKRIVDGIPVVSKVNNWLDIAYMGHMTNARYKSLMYVWTKQLTKPIMERPEDYSEEKIEELVDKYTKRAQAINEERSADISERTVIYILSESLADPSRIPTVTLSKDIIPNIRTIISKNTGGLMRSDGYGGGTANMENQSLLSLPYYNLSSAVSVMNTEVVPKMNYLPSISNLYDSKNRIAIHLGGAATYSRNDFYRRLGFEKFIATDGTAFEPEVIEEVGLYPSDEATYENILLNIDESKSQFFSVITYQNHIPWLYGEPSDVFGSSPEFTDAQNSELSNYARLVYQTDIVTKEFLDKLSQLNKDVTVVFYGDHLPGLYPDSIFSDNPELQYQAEYFIWSNHESKKLDYDYVNSSDFTAALLAHTDSKVTPYYALMTDVLDYASINQTQLSDDARTIANDLKLIQYDLMAGAKYLSRNENFFSKQP
ncbi:LTA synthase family protein [Streptococcus merionis]|uniref:LTA synthase family protein n=1 Tax=Streptococcus merionis TaxID=400065 RepID=UPI0035184D04